MLVFMLVFNSVFLALCEVLSVSYMVLCGLYVCFYCFIWVDVAFYGFHIGLCGFLYGFFCSVWGFLWFFNWFVYGFDQRKLGSNLPSYACNNTLNEGWCET